MITLSNFFYNFGTKSKIYTIEDNTLQKLKTLQSYVTESSYYDYMVVWHPNSYEPILCEDLWKSMQFILMTADLTDEIIIKYNLNTNVYLVSLLRKLYLELDDDKITMGFKRPFGNSFVLGDIREELYHCGIITSLDDDENDKFEYENEILQEFSEFVIDFFKFGFNIKYTSFEQSNDDTKFDNYICYWNELGIKPYHSYMRDWRLNKKELRDIKLDNILK